MEPGRQTEYTTSLYFHIDIWFDFLKIEASSFCNCWRIFGLLISEGKIILQQHDPGGLQDIWGDFFFLDNTSYLRLEYLPSNSK